MSAIDHSQNRCNKQSRAMLSRFKSKILVIGLWRVGLPVPKYLKERGFDTYGYDISIKAVDRQGAVDSDWASKDNLIKFASQDNDTSFAAIFVQALEDYLKRTDH